MSRLIGIIGASGSGKSTSIGAIPSLGYVGLDEKTTAIVNVMGKPLPFKNSYRIRVNKFNDVTNMFEKVQGGNMLISKHPVEIIQFLHEMNQNPNVKTIIIDDFQYVMSDELMVNAMVKGFDKFTKISSNAYFILVTGMNLRHDLNVVILTHSEPVYDSQVIVDYKIKTIGKMLDQNITLEGLFTVLLFSDSSVKDEKPCKVFITNDNGKFKQAKSPIGMFDSIEIPNDLHFVLEKVNSIL